MQVIRAVPTYLKARIGVFKIPFLLTIGWTLIGITLVADVRTLQRATAPTLKCLKEKENGSPKLTSVVTPLIEGAKVTTATFGTPTINAEFT